MRACSPPARRAIAHARRLAIIVLAWLFVSPVSSAEAQQRERQRHDFESSEGRILGFYSAALAFTGGGPAHDETAGDLSFALELAYVPYLTRVQRTAGFDKPQSSNLAPAYPRPRFIAGLPWRIRAEASWIPPLPLFDAKANLLSVAFSRPIGDLRGLRLVPRLALTGGYVEGAITCNEDLLDGGVDELVYYANVCYSGESEDRFEPLHASAELLASRPMLGGRFVPYVSGGARYESVRFDIGVIRQDGTRDQDHPILEMEATRPFALVGAQWRPYERFATGTEIFIAPGSLVTARVLATFALRGR